MDSTLLWLVVPGLPSLLGDAVAEPFATLLPVTLACAGGAPVYVVAEMLPRATSARLWAPS